VRADGDRFRGVCRLVAVLSVALAGLVPVFAAAAEVPPRVATLHATISGCEAGDGPSLAKSEPIVAGVSETATLVALPCLRTGANVLYRLYILESGEIGGIHPVYVATYSPRFGWMGADTVANIRYDANRKRLASVYKGRREDDCGANAEWIWKDYAFALETYAIKRHCKSGRWTTVFPIR